MYTSKCTNKLKACIYVQTAHSVHVHNIHSNLMSFLLGHALATAHRLTYVARGHEVGTNILHA